MGALQSAESSVPHNNHNTMSSWTTANPSNNNLSKVDENSANDDNTNDMKKLQLVNTTEELENHKHQTKTKIRRTGWDLVQHKCRRKKKRYDVCWSTWYNGKFLAGKQMDRDCDELFEEWRTCILRQMKQERQRQGLSPPKKGSMLAQEEEDDDE